MMRSMFSGVSGLRVHQTKMDVIANNISNVNTVGYKSSRVTFMDAFYQRLSGASAENPMTGRTGTNPMQIGLGANVASIDNIMTQGMSQRTDVSTDIMIQGNGFFVVSDASGTYFTRAGKIDRDAAHNLNINGMQLMGWDTTIDANTKVETIQVGPVQPLNLKGNKQYVPPSATSTLKAIGNLNVNELPTKEVNGVQYKEVITSMNIFDSEGNSYTVDTKFTYYPYVPGGTNLQDHVKGFWTFEFVTKDPNNLASGVLAYPDNDRKNPKVLSMHVGDATSFNTPYFAAPTTGGGTNVELKTTLEEFSPMGLLVYDTKGELVGWDTLNINTSLVDDVAVAKKPTLSEIQTQISGLGLTYDYTLNDVVAIPPTSTPTGPPTDPPTPSVKPRTLEMGDPPKMKFIIAPKDVVDPTATFGTPTDIPIEYIEYGGQTIGYDDPDTLAPVDESVDNPATEEDERKIYPGVNYVRAGLIEMDLSDLTQWGGNNTKLEINRVDGNEPGTLQDLSIGSDGKITGRYSNGQTKLLGQIAVAQFINPAGLEKVGSSLFAVTANSGPWNGVGESGDIMAGALEMSNVDLSQEFTEMITTQRGFQANSRTITVSDEMLQELVNLKR